MSEHAQSFIAYLSGLKERDRGALAQLKRSLGFDPGAYPPAYPYVERFVGSERHADDPWRKALYLAAGLFAFHPKQQEGVTFAAAFGEVARGRDKKEKRSSDVKRGCIEQRFVALLGAEPESLPTMLRQGVSLLAADGYACDFVRLLDDLARWINPYAIEERDDLRQRWARDFYRVYDSRPGPSDETDSTPINVEQSL